MFRKMWKQKVMMVIGLFLCSLLLGAYGGNLQLAEGSQKVEQ